MRHALIALTAAAGVLAAAAPARAQAHAQRPGIEVALGMGVSLDENGFNPQRHEPIPSFFAMGGFGAGLFGVDLAVFDSEALGRYRGDDKPFDRLAGEVLGVCRPLARTAPGVDAPGYLMRVARTFALAAGPAYERDNAGKTAASRWGVSTRAHVDLPLGPPGPSELRLRLGARRMLGFSTPTIASGANVQLKVNDSSADLFAAIAVSF